MRCSVVHLHHPRAQSIAWRTDSRRECRLRLLPVALEARMRVLMSRIVSFIGGAVVLLSVEEIRTANHDAVGHASHPRPRAAVAHHVYLLHGIGSPHTPGPRVIE